MMGNGASRICGLKHKNGDGSMEHFAGLEYRRQGDRVCIVDDVARSFGK